MAGARGERRDAVGFVVLVGRAEFVGVVAEEVLDVQLALGVELLEVDDGALAQAALDGVAVRFQSSLTRT